MKLIIITGLPCTGKTTLGKKISEQFAIPLISKDAIKELMCDFLGDTNEGGQQKASYSILFHIMGQHMKVGTDVIIESNFLAGISDVEIQKRIEKYPCDIVQIFCHTEGIVLFERFKKRAYSGERHEAHGDIQKFDKWEPILIKGEFDPLKISGKLIRVDTTNFENIDYEGLYKNI